MQGRSSSLISDEQSFFLRNVIFFTIKCKCLVEKIICAISGKVELTFFCLCLRMFDHSLFFLKKVLQFLNTFIPHIKISHYLTNGISLLFHRWEQQDITDGCCISEKHAETVDTDSESTCWRHTVFEGFNVVVVDACCFVVTEFFSSSLCFET